MKQEHLLGGGKEKFGGGSWFTKRTQELNFC